MSLETIISYGLTRPADDHHALVLMGGGARTAYQAGVLRALGRMMASPIGTGQSFPFRILVGTSAGALNVCYLASRAGEGLAAFDQLASFWACLRSPQVYQLKVPAWIRSSRIAAALFLSQQVRRQQAFLNNAPLVDTLHRAISLPRIEQALQDKTLLALAVTASSYTSGVHWTFCQTARGAGSGLWDRPGRRAEFQPITIEHLMASSAIPFLFPATPLWVDGHHEFFGDGSMRQSSPLSSSLTLGAGKILVIGVGQPERAGMTGTAGTSAASPTLGAIAGHALASYLLFEPGFVTALMALGERDAQARKDELLAFFGLPAGR